MKNLIFILAIIIFTGCSSIKIVDSWRSKEYTDFKPKKVLIVAIGFVNSIAFSIFSYKRTDMACYLLWLMGCN